MQPTYLHWPCSFSGVRQYELNPRCTISPHWAAHRRFPGTYSLSRPLPSEMMSKAQVALPSCSQLPRQC